MNHLCHERYKQLIPDPDDFAAFLEDHPRLAKAMDSADAYFAGRLKKQREANEAERQARWEKKQAEKYERIAREKKAAESLKQKMSATAGSGLMMATAEEAELLRRR